ncbi:MAG: class I SAM-dependent rRNA methyltransferase [Saprospiraceae bacterium]|nr:class I SAM-dependent rRNA methyltransferase [Saprospiraceae bacterium]
MKKVFLKKKKAAPLRRFHPWVFSGAVAKMEGEPADGDVVEVYDAGGEYLATGHYQNGSICVRVFSFKKTDADDDFWRSKIENAFHFRQQIQLGDTDCYRLVHAEGDGLPGLIIDRYGKTAVVQCHSIGMHQERHKIAQALQTVFGDQLDTIYDKSSETLPKAYGATVENSFLFGESQSTKVKENGHSFLVNWAEGQKTGFFLDQRDNRQLVGQYAAGKKVLNAFCYTGGFSIYALQGGAKEVHSVDISQKAIDLTNENVAINEFEQPHHAYAEDVLRFLKDTTQTYDLMVVDPPAFAKNLKKRHNAVQGYKRLNALALQHVKKGGFVFTFSCSQVVDQQLFYNTIVAAAIEAGRQIRVLHHLSQGADHPVSLFHPEGAYLKGLVLYVE